MTSTNDTTPERKVNPDAVGATVVLGAHYYGRGKAGPGALAEAKANFRRVGGRLSDGYVVLTFDEVTEFKGVDDLGRVHWATTDGSDPHDHAPADRNVEPRR